MKYCEEYAALLDPYVDGELSGEEAARVRNHVAECPGCRTYVEGALAIRAAFPDVEETAVPEGFAEGVMAAVRKSEERRQEEAVTATRKNGYWKRVLLPLAACFALVLILRTVPAGGSKGAVMTAVGSGLPAAADSASPAEEGGVQYSMADPAPQTETGETAPFNDRMVRAAPLPQAIQEEPADPSAESTPEERGTVATASNGGRIAVQTPRAIRLTAAQAGELLEELPHTTAEDGVRCYQLTWEEFDRLLDSLAERDIVPEEQEDAPEAEGLSEGYDLVYVTEE